MANIQEKDRVDELAEKAGQLMQDNPEFLITIAKIQQELIVELVASQTRREYMRAGKIIVILKDIALLKSAIGKPNGDGQTGA
jgi:hypothetical protein